MNRYLRYGLLVGIFAVPFIPFIVTPSLFFPFITGKNFTFRILVEIMLAAWLVLAYREPAYRPKRSVLFYSLVAFLLTMAVSTLLAENPFKSFWSNFERMEGYVSLLHLGAYFLVLGSVLNKESLWERWFQTSLLANVLMCFYGLMQFYGLSSISQSGSRLDATLGNATYLAVYTIFHFFIAGFLFLRHREELWARYIYGAAALLNLFVLYYTATRGAILGVLAGVLVTAAVVAILERGGAPESKLIRRVSLGLLGAVVVLVLLFFSVKETSFVKNSPVLSRFASISLSEGTTKARFLVWDMAFQGLKERPVFGWGQENFNYVFNKFYNPKMYDQEQWFDRTHNVFFDWLIAGGFSGLLAYLSLFLSALYILFRRGSFSVPEQAVFLGMFAAYFVHNLFVFDNLVSYLYFFAILSYLHFREVDNRPGEVPSESPEGGGYRLQVLVSSVFVGLLVIIYFFNVRALSASSLLIQAITPGQTPAQALNYFKQALSKESLGDQEIREQLSQVASSLRNFTEAPLEAKQQFFDLARTELIKMIGEAPNDTRHPLFLGALFNNYGLHAEASPYLERARVLSPRKQSVLYEIGSNYLNARDFQNALQIFKTAFELEEGNREARIIYAMGAIYAGDSALAKSLLTEGFGTALLPDNRLIKAYGDTKQYAKMLELVQEKLKEKTDAQGYLTLASAYCQMNRGGEAILALRKVIELGPNYKDQAEFYIKEIQAGRECVSN